jgi:hypothetical protein
MKQYITVDDLNTLSENQKQALNSMWLPEKYDHVAAKVCVDAENDIYEDFEFVVGGISIHRGSDIILRRLRLLDEIAEDNNTATHDEITEEDETSLNEASEEEEFNIDISDPGDYFMKENCLPLLNIGQLISFLRRTKAGQNGFSIGIPAVDEHFDEQSFTLDDRFGEAASADELVDLLFDMIKTVI